MADTKRVAAITGASSGIGEVFARTLAARGYALMLIARRRDRLAKLAGEIGGEVIAADLTDDDDLRRVEERLRAESRLEMLVNNAGFGAGGAFAKADLEAQDRMHRLHIMATMSLADAARRRSGGR